MIETGLGFPDFTVLDNTTYTTSLFTSDSSTIDYPDDRKQGRNTNNIRRYEPGALSDGISSTKPFTLFSLWRQRDSFSCNFWLPRDQLTGTKADKQPLSKGSTRRLLVHSSPSMAGGYDRYSILPHIRSSDPQAIPRSRNANLIGTESGLRYERMYVPKGLGYERMRSSK